MAALTHFDDKGDAHMVDVSDKDETERTATAGARVLMRAETLELIMGGGHAKGDVLSVSDADGNDVVDLELVAAHDLTPQATHPAHLEIEITSDIRATL